MKKILLIFERYDNNNNIDNVEVAYDNGELEIMHTSPNCTWNIFLNNFFLKGTLPTSVHLGILKA
jgi:hypothetical protein